MPVAVRTHGPPVSGCEGLWATRVSPMCLLYSVGEMRGLDRTGNEGSLPVCCWAESLPAGGCCVIPSPCPHFQTCGRQRGRGGKRWRVGWRLGSCLETSTSPVPHVALCVPLAFHISLPAPHDQSRESRFRWESGSTHPLLLCLGPAV